jgi:protease-4
MCDAGLLLIDGLGFESYYLADALAKIGVRFRAVASGEHKTAHEPFTRNGPSPAGLAELDELAHGLDRAVRDLSVREGTDLVKIRARAPQTPAIAAELGLVDVVAERGAWLADLPEPVRWVGSEEVGSRDLSGMAGLLEVWSQLLKTAEHPHHPQAVAVVELEGEIVDGAWSDPGSTIAGDDTADLMDDLAGDERIKAVVLRINSPGGAAGASDRIHHAVRRLSGAKPVVALFDQYAASGGYYIGCAADEILAHRTTVTGSIGVFALVPDASAALDLLGVRRVSVTTAPRAEVFSVTAPFTPDREAAIAQVIADVDQRFQGLVAERRKLTARRTQELAGGRVFTGDQAVANGLADGIGSLADAVSAARKRAGIDAKLPLERYPRPQGLFQRLGFATGTQIAADLLPPALRAQLALLPRLATGRPLIQARGLVPFEMR